MDAEHAAAVEYSRILARILGINANDLPHLLKGTSLSVDQFMSMEGYLSWPDQHKIISNALEWNHGHSNKPGLGLAIAAKTPQPLSFGILGMAAMSCETVLESLRVLIHYQSIRCQFNQTELMVKNDHIILRSNLRVDADHVGVFLRDAWIVTLATTLGLLLGKDVKSIQLSMGFSAPEYENLFHQLLPCPFQFDQPHTEFIFPRHFGDKPIPTHDAHTKQWAIQLCEHQYQHLKHLTRFAERTRHILRSCSGQLPNQETIANELNVSVRTFSRRLKEEGCTYKQLVDEEQKRLARHYFDNTELTIETISDLVGYQDISSFRRAFKRWFQIPPSQYPRYKNP